MKKEFNCIITGSGGLVGSEAVKFFVDKFDNIFGIDNDQRKKLFGTSVSNQIEKNREFKNYFHLNGDIRDKQLVNSVMSENTTLIIHAAAQPSHDWATKDVRLDFEINALGTLNIMEAARKYCPDAVVVYVSTNKVYGDFPNHLPGYYQSGKRINKFNAVFNEDTPIDNVKHSFFGCSKLAADLYVQEYGKYLGMKTGCFRCGCITGASHAGAELHGFLSYLFKCAKEGIPYSIYGYDGLQVRDNIHAADLVNAFWHFYQNPKKGEVYNMGGGEDCNCSVLEAIDIIEEITGNKVAYTVSGQERIGDHKFWVSDTSKFKKDYPGWKLTYSLKDIITEMNNAYEAKNFHTAPILSTPISGI